LDERREAFALRAALCMLDGDVQEGQVKAPVLRNTSEAAERCRRYRKRILEISQQVTALHCAPAFSCVEIVDAVYNILMRRDGDPAMRDTFIMSKGHGYLSQLVILEEMGVLPRRDLDEYCTPEGRLGAHPDFGVPGIEATSGSLGHGFGIAVGMGAADRILGHDRRIFVVVGDGEMQEGSSWEAAMMAPNLQLNNLVVFLDFNNYQGLGRTSESHPYFDPMGEKLASFGWAASEIDGHDTTLLVETVRRTMGRRPTFVVCRTIKGQGVSFMQNDPIWHYRSPNKAEYQRALAELDSTP
jgi:transketolase